MFALFALSGLIILTVVAEVQAKRHDRTRIANGSIPLPAHERPLDTKIGYDPEQLAWSRR